MPRTLGSSCIASTHRFRRFEVLAHRVDPDDGLDPVATRERDARVEPDIVRGKVEVRVSDFGSREQARGARLARGGVEAV